MFFFFSFFFRTHKTNRELALDRISLDNIFFFKSRQLLRPGEDLWVPSDSLSKDQESIVKASFDDSECTKDSQHTPGSYSSGIFAWGRGQRRARLGLGLAWFLFLVNPRPPLVTVSAPRTAQYPPAVCAAFSLGGGGGVGYDWVLLGFDGVGVGFRMPCSLSLVWYDWVGFGLVLVLVTPRLP